MVQFNDFNFISPSIESVMENGPIVSKLKDDFEPKNKLNISSFKRLPVTKENFQKYALSYKPEADFDFKKIHEGYMWVDGNNLVGFVVTSIDTYDSTKIWINALEVSPDFRGCGLAPQILKVATSSLHAKYLGVSKRNEVALAMYKKAGFKIYDDTRVSYFMKI